MIAERADADKPNMGLTTWKNAPAGPIRRTDVAVAKNYLTREELDALERVVVMYLDYAEDQARRQQPMHMADWVAKLDRFLAFNDRDILTHAGSVSADMARDHAEKEFAKLEAAERIRQATEPTSDFDRAVEKIKRLGTAADRAPSPPPPNPPTTAARKESRRGEDGD